MMRAPRFWDRDVDPKSREGAPVTRAILTPLSAAYAAITARRIETTVPLKLDIPVICIGNLTAGGSGKSPVAAAVRKQLAEQHEGLRIATLSRGYGGKLKGPLKVDRDSHSAADVGDEALMLAQTGEAWIGADRADTGQEMQDDGVDVIIMDDGFQNPSLAKTVSLVVVDAHSGFGNGHVIPKGPLREPVASGLARADAVILMGSGAPPEELDGFAGPVLTASITPASAPAEGTYVAFAGIGRPEKFFDIPFAKGAMILGAPVIVDRSAEKEERLRQIEDAMKTVHDRAASIISNH